MSPGWAAPQSSLETLNRNRCTTEQLKSQMWLRTPEHQGGESQGQKSACPSQEEQRAQACLYFHQEEKATSIISNRDQASSALSVSWRWQRSVRPPMTSG